MIIPIIVKLLVVMFLVWLVYFANRSRKWAFALWFPVTATAAIGTLLMLNAIHFFFTAPKMHDLSDLMFVGVLILIGNLAPFPIVLIVSFWKRPLAPAYNRVSVLATILGYTALLGLGVFAVESSRTPIRFYGKVLDEKGNPIPEVTVKYETENWTWSLADAFENKSRHTDYERRSDANGLFSITGITGDSFNLHVTKDGYYEVKDHTQFRMDKVDTKHDLLFDPQQPVVFRLRKKGEAAFLVSNGKYFHFPVDGTPVEIDLSTTKAVSQGKGDFKVECWIKQPSGKNANRRRNYDWRCRISVPDGGLVEIPSSEEFPFEAPLEGYQPFFEDNVLGEGGSEKWRGGTEERFYLKLRNGNFARLNIEVNTQGSPQPWFRIDYCLGLSDSRNLEYDPSRVIGVDPPGVGSGATPLHWAALSDHKDVAEWLLAHNAEVNATDDRGWTPLHFAAQSGHKDLAAFLLSHGADVNAKDKEGWTPLHIAAWYGHDDVAEVLLSHNAQINSKADWGETPLHLAIEHNYRDLADLLRQHGAKE